MISAPWLRLRGLWIGLFVVLTLWIPSMSAQDAKPVPRFEASDCPFQNNSGYAIDCGFVIAPEDHYQPENGKTVRLAAAILRSHNANKAPDPIVYLAGGPGGAFVKTAPMHTATFSYLLAQRDVVLFDQRGIGLSQPSVTCALQNTLAIVTMDATRPEFTDTLRTIGGTAECEERFRNEGLDITRYDTEQNAADIDAVRVALGYAEINLFGQSWGTRLGLVALRQKLPGIRSAIFDAVLPPEFNGLEYGAAGFDRAFRAFEEVCAQDLLCRTAYPNLREVYIQTYERLQADPVTFMVQGQPYIFTADAFAGEVYNSLVYGPGIKALPALITNLAHGDYEQVQTNVETIAQAIDEGAFINVGAFFAYTCSADTANTTLASLQQADEAYPPAFRRANPFFGVGGYRTCQAWEGELRPLSTAPAVSDVPTLLLSGQFDPLLPPEWADSAAGHLSTSYHFTYTGVGHLTSENTCARQMMVAFLNHPQAAPDASCMQATGAPTFALSIVVTRPVVQVAALLLSGTALWALALVLWALRAGGYRRIAWWTSLKLMSWIPLAATGLFLLWGALSDESIMPLKGLTFLQTIMPLTLTLQAGLVFASDDEPGLEMLLALPRPLAWIIVERLGLVLLTQTALAFVAAGLYLTAHPEQDALMLLVSWMPPALFLAGISIYITMRTRVMILGALVGGFLWFAFAMFGEFFLPGQAYPFPLNLVQPFLWPLHLYATRTAFASVSDFWLNRAFLIGAGGVLMFFAVREVRHEESVLLRAHDRQQRRAVRLRAPKVQDDKLKREVRLQPASVNIVPLRQLVGIIWRECVMHYRRRAIWVLTLTILLGGAVTLAILGGSLNSAPGMPDVNLMTAAEQVIARGNLMILMATLVFCIVLYIMPMVMADAVPLDAQQGMAEVLGALPVGDGIYLIGKMLGLFLAVAIGLTGALVLLAGFAWLVIGAFDPRGYLDMALIALGFALTRGGMAVLIGATQPTRRRAALAMLGAFILSAAVTPGLDKGGGFFDLVSALPLTFYVRNAMTALATMPPTMAASGFSSVEILVSLLRGTLLLLVTGGLTWAWRRQRQA